MTAPEHQRPADIADDDDKHQQHQAPATAGAERAVPDDQLHRPPFLAADAPVLNALYADWKLPPRAAQDPFGGSSRSASFVLIWLALYSGIA
jgi:hypothetical protein